MFSAQMTRNKLLLNNAVGMTSYIAMEIMRITTSVASTLFYMVVYSSIVVNVHGDSCDKTILGQKYDFIVAVLSPEKSSESLQSYIDSHIKTNDTTIKGCFAFTTMISLKVENGLDIPTQGWTHIISQTKSALTSQAFPKKESGVSVIIGPYYTNIAMMTERPEFFTPYIVTDYKGFDWVDENRVESDVRWQSLVDIKPSPRDVNTAIVDLFKSKAWKSTFLIEPYDWRDNQECFDLQKQLIKEEVSPIPNYLHTRTQDRNKMKSEALQLLRTSQLLNIKVLLVCSPRDGEQGLIALILEAARDFQLLDDESNTLILMDTAFYLEPLKELNMYREGLFKARADVLAYRYTDIKDQGQTPLSAEEATAVDALEILKIAQKKYLSYIAPMSEDFTKLNRSILLKSLKTSNLANGMTGNVQFDSRGRRTNYTLHLYRHGGGVELYQKVGIWSSNGRNYKERFQILHDNTTTTTLSRGIFDGPVKVVVVQEEPFVMIKENGKVLKGNKRFEGFTIDLLKALADKLQMDYTIYQSPGNMYGAVDKKGRWNGIVGEVMAGNATLGMGAISITSAREKVVDFSLGVITTGVNMLISKPKPKTTMFQFMKPFSINLWMAIVGVSVGLSILYFVLDYKSDERLFTAKETLWFSIGTLLMRGTDFSPRPTSQRILTAGFTFFVLITVSTYTANLAAFLTRKSLEVPINNLEDLVERTNFEVGTTKNSATMTFLKKGEKSIHRLIWERIQESDGLVRSAAEGIERAGKGNYAFIFDFLINRYAEYTHCNTTMVGIPFRLQEHGIVMKAGASFKTRLNIALLELKEEGKIQELKIRWWDNKRTCDIQDDKGPNVEFTLIHMAGVFIVGGFGLMCSVAFFLFKKFYLLAKKPVDKQESEKKDKIMIDDTGKSKAVNEAVNV